LPAGELRELFIGIRNDLPCEEPVGDEGSVVATLRKMSDEDACELIERLMRLNRELRNRVVVIKRIIVDPIPEGSASKCIH
jgi:hypothetical protein